MTPPRRFIICARYAHAVAGELPEVGPEGDPLVLRGARHPLLLARLPNTRSATCDVREVLARLSRQSTGGTTIGHGAANRYQESA